MSREGTPQRGLDHHVPGNVSFGRTLLLLAVGASMAGLAVNLALADQPGGNVLYRAFLALVAVTLVGAVAIRMWTSAAGLRIAVQSQGEFQTAADHAVAVLERALPQHQASLDEDLSEITTTLVAAVDRLRDISQRADAYGEAVRRLVDQADQARAAVQLHENEARKIAQILGREADASLRAEIAKLTEAHGQQIERLRRSGTRAAWLTFVAGSLLGFVINIATAFITG